MIHAVFSSDFSEADHGAHPSGMLGNFPIANGLVKHSVTPIAVRPMQDHAVKHGLYR